MPRGQGRGLLVTPWFAAGTGFVLAAAMWIYSPHAELQFPRGVPGVQPCGQPACSSGSGSGTLAGTGKGVGHARADAETHVSAATATTFRFALLVRRDGTYWARITMTGKQPTGTAWRLTFTMPGDRIENVTGAIWQFSPSSDSVTVTNAVGQAGSPPGFGAASSWPFDGGYGYRGGRRSQGLDIIVVAAGPEVLPVGCVYNGAACSFS